MKHGYIKVAAVSPDLKVADCIYNTDKIIEEIDQLSAAHVKIMVFPELCISGYSCRDLFWQGRLLKEANDQLLRLVAYSAGIDALILVGLPFEVQGKLYNVAAVINQGKLLGLVPKHSLPTYNEFYEGRQFTAGSPKVSEIDWQGEKIPFGMNQIFTCADLPHLSLAIELCEDLWVPNPPSISHALHGASIIANLSASNEVIGKADYRRNLVSGQSARLICGYIYASAGIGESSTDLVFGGHDLIAENGSILAQTERFSNAHVISEIDIDRLSYERRRMSTYPDEAADAVLFAASGNSACYKRTLFHLKEEETQLTRSYPKHPFVPSDPAIRNSRCHEILNIQAHGLAKRLKHIGCKSVVLGISGGLDSTLALLVAARAYDLLGLDRKDITAVTMPCFGTTDRTLQNAILLTKKIDASLIEAPIHDAVTLHFETIGQDPNKHDITYENSQARERTQVLMDLSNKLNGIVIGTGDLSELALGWATYNGDHMSMYGVNASVPKTLVRYLVQYYADTCGQEELKAVLEDILDTPVSPELLPPENGTISQKTEDLVGPYELHDFYLYYMLRAGFEPKKILRLANLTFKGIYSEEIQLKWLKTFYRRFFSQQFKRSALPDGPKVGSVALSPRGDLRMPSDACARIWSEELDNM
jgi:NAD+ synthase (glutamine-hydrolysing)